MPGRSPACAGVMITFGHPPRTGLWRRGVDGEDVQHWPRRAGPRRHCSPAKSRNRSTSLPRATLITIAVTFSIFREIAGAQREFDRYWLSHARQHDHGRPLHHPNRSLGHTRMTSSTRGSIPFSGKLRPHAPTKWRMPERLFANRITPIAWPACRGR